MQPYHDRRKIKGELEMSVLYSLWILVFGIAVTFIAGIPVTQFAFNRNGSVLERDELWALAPFMGYGVIACVLNLLVKMDIPVQYTALPLFLVITTVFIFLFVKKSREKKLRTLLPTRAFVLIFLAILALVSFAYLRIGAKWYKGYGWWDSTFYGMHPEALKTTPLSEMAALTGETPYFGNFMWAYGGTHRISCAVLQAFVAELTGTDGVSTLGFISIYANVLVFCGLLYATKDVPMRKWMRYAGCGFSSVIPNVVYTHLECFIPVCLFISFVIVSSKLFVEILDGPNIYKSVLVGFFVAASITTLLDGVYLLVGLAALALIAVVIAHRTSFFRGLLHVAVTFGSAWLLNLPYRTYLLDEWAHSVSARSRLNDLASFAYSPRVLDRAFWGTLLADDTGFKAIVNMSLTLVAIGLLVIGLYALIHLLIRKHMVEGLTFCALAFSPIVFLIENEDCRYAFYKLFTFAIPLISCGSWIFGDICLDELDTSFLLEPANRLERLLRRLAKPVVCVALCGTFILSVCGSVQRINIAIQDQTGGREGQADTQWGCVFFQPDYEALYSELDTMAGENLLIVDTEMSLPYWWMTYYARHNYIYSLTDEIDDKYYAGQENARSHCENIPMDSKIVWTPRAYNMVIDVEKQDDFAAVLQTQTDVHTVISQWEVPTDNSFRLYAFARNAAEAELVLSAQSVDPSGQPAVIYFQNEAYTVDAASVTQLHIPLRLTEGGQMIEFTSSTNISLSSWLLNIGESNA